MPEKGLSLLVQQTEMKDSQNLTKSWQTKSSIRGGDYGVYDYDDHYDIKHTGRLQQQLTNPGHQQTDITFCSPVRVRILATGLAVISSATGPTEYLKY